MSWWIWVLIGYFGINFILAILCTIALWDDEFLSFWDKIGLFFMILFIGIPIVIWKIIR